MSWTPLVKSEHSTFDSKLVFAEKVDAMTSAASQASYLKSVYLKIVSVDAIETDAMPNHVLREGLLVRINQCP